jgi:hypothetical protein
MTVSIRADRRGLYRPQVASRKSDTSQINPLVWPLSGHLISL